MLSVEHDKNLTTLEMLSIIGGVIEKSKVDGIINPILFDVYLDVNYFLYNYSQEGFDLNDFQNNFDLYDYLKEETNFFEEIDYNEDYLRYRDYARSWRQLEQKKMASLVGIVSEIGNLVSNIDLSKLQEMLGTIEENKENINQATELIESLKEVEPNLNNQDVG